MGDGTATPSREEDGWFMTFQGPWGRERRRVDRVLGSGRTHQLYVTSTSDCRHRLLPLYWASLGEQWASLGMYRPAALDPAAPDYWARGSLTEYGCLDCHASQTRYRVADDGILVDWIDGPINCEACHGPGREQGRLRCAEREEHGYPDLHAVGKAEDLRLCGQCHGLGYPYRFGSDRTLAPGVAFETLAFPGIRPDGTQGDTVYQVSAHSVSECYLKGSMTCSGCHEPHASTARDLAGRSAEGEATDRQCTACHRSYLEPAAARRHSFHSEKVSCVDCHMSWSWMLDNPASLQRTSDHSVSIPRPRETLELGTPNACNATGCHDDHGPRWALAALAKWGQRTAMETREWVRTISLARRGAPGSTPRLLALLRDADRGDYLHASALALLARQEPDPAVAPHLVELAAHPSHELRALAIQALVVHDREHAPGWRERGSQDAHPYVRMVAFEAERDEETLDDETIRRAFEDHVGTVLRPTVEVELSMRLAGIYLRREDWESGWPYVVLARRWATPEQAESLGLAGLERLYSDLGPAGGVSAGGRLGTMARHGSRLLH